MTFWAISKYFDIYAKAIVATYWVILIPPSV